MSRHCIQVKPAADLEDVLGYKFKKPALLHQALTYPSAVTENHPKACDRDLPSLAFVGDAVLKYAVARYLFLNGLDNVTRSRAQLHEGTQKIIPDTVLAAIAREKLHLEEYLVRGNAHLTLNTHLYADCMEAILGAIALDCGTDRQELIFRVIEKMCSDRIETMLVPTPNIRLVSATHEYTIDWPRSELQSAFHTSRTSLSLRERSCSQMLGQWCLWFFAAFGFCTLCYILYILINGYQPIFSKVPVKRRWYEF